jgi:hypothetical protein
LVAIIGEEIDTEGQEVLEREGGVLGVPFPIPPFVAINPLLIALGVDAEISVPTSANSRESLSKKLASRLSRKMRRALHP